MNSFVKTKTDADASTKLFVTTSLHYSTHRRRVGGGELATAPPEKLSPHPKCLPPQPKFAYLNGQHELWRAKISEFLFKS